jgi:hypothetical protein
VALDKPFDYTTDRSNENTDYEKMRYASRQIRFTRQMEKNNFCFSSLIEKTKKYKDIAKIQVYRTIVEFKDLMKDRATPEQLQNLKNLLKKKNLIKFEELEKSRTSTLKSIKRMFWCN